jgi:hypothetical protein
MKEKGSGVREGGVMLFFEYMGFTIHHIGLRRYLVIGSGFRGYIASVIEAVKIIDGFIAGQCEY